VNLPRHPYAYTGAMSRHFRVETVRNFKGCKPKPATIIAWDGDAGQSLLCSDG